MQPTLFDSPLALRLYVKPWDIQAFRLGASIAGAQRAGRCEHTPLQAAGPEDQAIYAAIAKNYTEGRCEVGHSGCSNLPAIPHNSKQVNTPQKGK